MRSVYKKRCSLSFDNNELILLLKKSDCFTIVQPKFKELHEIHLKYKINSKT